MCTAVTYRTKNHYFGRNLDLEHSYDEAVTVVPRNFPFRFRKAGSLETQYAIIGMATMAGGYPLFYDATNEKGLSIAGLSFPGYADYKPQMAGKDNIAPFELTAWLLGQCANRKEARTLLERINLVNIHFSDEYPLTPLHWMIADREGSITAEPVREGLKIYENPAGVLTNSPPFDIQLFNLNNYMRLTAEEPQNSFSDALELKTYSKGMGALGLPGDLSSMSGFVRAAFARMNSRSGESEPESVSQFFHILGSVAQQRGLVRLGDGKYEITVYSSCCSTDRGIYYYTTYENSRITAVDMYRENLDGDRIRTYPLITGPQICMQNGAHPKDRQP